MGAAAGGDRPAHAPRQLAQLSAQAAGLSCGHLQPAQHLLRSCPAQAGSPAAHAVNGRHVGGAALHVQQLASHQLGSEAVASSPAVQQASHAPAQGVATRSQLTQLGSCQLGAGLGCSATCVQGLDTRIAC